jgi:NADH-quinone oxidoreductase subunit H
MQACTVGWRRTGPDCRTGLVGLVFLTFYALLGLFLVYLERKVCAVIQNRYGPNRVGPMGLFQTIADLIKLLMKELIPIRRPIIFCLTWLRSSLLLLRSWP